MKYKLFSPLATLLCLSLIACNPSTQNKQADAFPNIILLMSDDQGWGDTEYNGHPYLKTPNLNSMVANGIEFTRFYAGSAVCSPTRGSVITGRHPMRYGICHANCGHLKKEEVNLAELVKERNYTTGHFGKWHLGTLTTTEIDANRGGRAGEEEHYAPPWENGFDQCFVTESKVPTWDPMVVPSKESGDVSKNLDEGKYFGTAYWTGPGLKVVENLEGDDSRIIMDRVLPFIDHAVNQKSPFLAVVWFHTPHLPVLTGEKYRSLYKDLSEDEQHYFGCITAMDEQIGRLRQHLKKLNIAENTVLFYTSDNGPEGKSQMGRTQGSTKNLKGRKRSLLEGGIRVPGIMEWPKKIDVPRKVSVPAYTADYFVTIADILNIDLEKYKRPFDGESLLPIIESDHLASYQRELPFLFQNQAALIQNRYKIYSSDGGVNFSLFDLNSAAGENKEVENQKQKEKMVLKWKSWHQSVEKSANGDDY